MDDARALILYSLDTEFQAFQAVLRECPEKMFGQRPSWGHSVAWHALHIMDWTRCIIQPGLLGINPALTYGYLGFEQEIWAKAVTGPTLAQEQDGKQPILAAVEDVFEQALKDIRHAPAERFSSQAMFAAIKKPRPVLESLLYHVTHTAYHRGQVILSRRLETTINSPQYGKSTL
ncbi:DinB family protein [Deinococcus saxicola]|uniref:DinB family protein n=1 Tax=Deinococcus saxicola TaxID=249406 RepID=UPI0039F126CB